MRSTFMGLETNKRGLYTQQSALYTTGHNIANANTLGYSRQRVNMEATAGHPGIGLNAGTMPGFLGTGVQSGSIQRIRDGFVDHRYRQETNELGYWDSRSKAISQMEDVLNEPSHYGLQKSLSEFWQSLEDLVANPEDSGVRRVVTSRGQAVADSFNYMHTSLKQIQTDLGTEITTSVVDVNSILQQISEINNQIMKVEPNGYLPNDLYDARDVLLDELAEYFPIEIEKVPSGGRALAIAEGSLTVSMKINGTTVKLVEGKEATTLSAQPEPLVSIAPDGTVTNNPIVSISTSGLVGVPPAIPPTAGTTIPHGALIEAGKMKSLMNSYGKDDGAGNAIGLYPDMIEKLNDMAREFASKINDVHKGGTDLNGAPGEDFFTGTTADTIKVSDALVGHPDKIAAAISGGIEEGNNKNAQKLANVQFEGINNLGGATIQSYFQGIIGELGVDGKEADRNTKNAVILLGAVEHRRASISSVSLDEEMTDMIRFQQAYNASARMITVVDETLEKIINGMGVVGR